VKVVAKITMGKRTTENSIEIPTLWLEDCPALDVTKQVQPATNNKQDNDQEQQPEAVEPLQFKLSGAKFGTLSPQVGVARFQK